MVCEPLHPVRTKREERAEAAPQWKAARGHGLGEEVRGRGASSPRAPEARHPTVAESRVQTPLRQDA